MEHCFRCYCGFDLDDMSQESNLKFKIYCSLRGYFAVSDNKIPYQIYFVHI